MCISYISCIYDMFEICLFVSVFLFFKFYFYFTLIFFNLFISYYTSSNCTLHWAKTTLHHRSTKYLVVVTITENHD